MTSDLQDLEQRVRALEAAVDDLARRLGGGAAPQCTPDDDADDAASIAMDAAVGPEGFPAA